MDDRLILHPLVVSARFELAPSPNVNLVECSTMLSYDTKDKYKRRVKCFRMRGRLERPSVCRKGTKETHSLTAASPYDR